METPTNPGKKLPPKLEPLIIAKAAQGHTTRQISAWLLEEHGIEYSHNAVARIIRAHRTERADIAKGVVRDELGHHLNHDLERLEAIRASLERRGARHGRKGDVASTKVWLAITELELKVIDHKLHYAGADTPDSQDDAIALAGERIAGKLARLLAQEGEDIGDADAGGEGGA